MSRTSLVYDWFSAVPERPFTFSEMPIDLFSSPLPPGSPAPDFTLADQDGNLVNLASLRGSNVILVFYPKDETPVCRQQLCEFRDRFAITAAKDTRVFGVNPGSAQSHAGFRRNNSLPFPLL